MRFLNKLLVLTTLSFTVSAVTPILAQNGCAEQPSWNAQSGYSGTLFLRAWSIDGNQSFELEGHGGQTKKYSENGVEVGLQSPCSFPWPPCEADIPNSGSSIRRSGTPRTLSGVMVLALISLSMAWEIHTTSAARRIGAMM